MIHETFKCTCYEIVTKRDLCKCRFLAVDVLHWGLSGTYVTLSRGQMKKKNYIHMKHLADYIIYLALNQTLLKAEHVEMLIM